MSSLDNRKSDKTRSNYKPGLALMEIGPWSIIKMFVNFIHCGIFHNIIVPVRTSIQFSFDTSLRPLKFKWCRVTVCSSFSDLVIYSDLQDLSCSNLHSSYTQTTRFLWCKLLLKSRFSKAIEIDISFQVGLCPTYVLYLYWQIL